MSIVSHISRVMIRGRLRLTDGAWRVLPAQPGARSGRSSGRVQRLEFRSLFGALFAGSLERFHKPAGAVTPAFSPPQQP